MNNIDSIQQAKLCLLVASIALAAPALRAQASNDKEAKRIEPQKLETFEVTGSRIKRLDAETPSPVVTYTAENLAERGTRTSANLSRASPLTPARPTRSSSPAASRAGL